MINPRETPSKRTSCGQLAPGTPVSTLPAPTDIFGPRRPFCGWPRELWTTAPGDPRFPRYRGPPIVLARAAEKPLNLWTDIAVVDNRPGDPRIQRYRRVPKVPARSPESCGQPPRGLGPRADEG